MNAPIIPATPGNPTEFRIFAELILMVGLPVMSVFVGCLLAFNAYVHGFTQLPTPAPAAAAVHAH